MEYLLLYTPGTDPQPYDPAADNIGEWVDDLIARGISEWGERLRPGTDATTVRVRQGRTLATEGPFGEGVGGFDVIRCDDLDEAISVAAAHPAAGPAPARCARSCRAEPPGPSSPTASTGSPRPAPAT